MFAILVAAPLLAAVFSPLAGKLGGPAGAYVIATAGSCVSLAGLAGCVVATQSKPTLSLHAGAWFATQAQGAVWELGLKANSLPVVAAVLVVSGVVVVYSAWYIATDPYAGYFVGLVQGFVFFMLLLLLAEATPLLFLGWEGIGILSFLLISFWQTRNAAVQASMQGFVLNRGGDLALVLAVVCLLASSGTLELSVLAQIDHGDHVLVYWLLLGGAAGKSAQLGLHAWLPSAMEAPTPVSALIHAATLVTAGVYLLACLAPRHLGYQGGLALGASTLLLAGVVGLTQSDLKRTIAFSTCSQVAYMVLGLGGADSESALLLLFTHAFYKALLFMSAGVVIHASSNNQDLRAIGGNGFSLPVSKELFTVGSLSLCAFPSTAGDFSKDLLVEQLGYSSLALHHTFWLCALAGTVLTGAYSGRLLRLAFASEPRGGGVLPQHEPRAPVLLLMALLGELSYLSGLIMSERPEAACWEALHTLGAELGSSALSSLWPLLSVALGVTLGLLAPRAPTRVLYWAAVNQVLWEAAVTRLVAVETLAASRVSAKGLDQGAWEAIGPHGLASLLWAPGPQLLKPSSVQTSSYLAVVLLVVLGLFGWQSN